MSPQRELGGEQALVHPPTHVGGSWDKALWAHGTRHCGLMGDGVGGSQKRVGMDQI